MSTLASSLQCTPLTTTLPKPLMAPMEKLPAAAVGLGEPPAGVDEPAAGLDESPPPPPPQPATKTSASIASHKRFSKTFIMFISKFK
jgi:hypothetical protein